jgi:FAD synthase
MIEISGKVISGQGYGRKLGFPTANLDRRQYVREKLKVRLGIWAGKAEIQNEKFRMQNRQTKNPHCYKAAIVIGPIDKTGLPKIEAHLIGYKGNLYGKKVSIYLSIYLRRFKKFKSEQELKKQISIDINKVKKL